VTATGGPTVDGAITATGALDGGGRNSHAIVVPDHTTATITVTPSAREDVIAEFDGLTFDDGLFGEPESFQVTGPKRSKLIIYSTFNHGPGQYSISVTS
jgi:hypothetical protein